MRAKMTKITLSKVFVIVMIMVAAVTAETVTASVGATTEILASGPPLIDPAGIVVSPDGRTLFITDFSANAIFSLPTTGGTPIVIASGVPFSRGITISPDGKTLFIANLHGRNVLSLPATGGVPIVIASGSPFVTPHDVEISPDGSTLFIADNNAGAIFSLPATGGVPIVIASGSPFVTPHDVEISPDGSTLFIADPNVGIFSLPATGGTPTLIASGSPFILPIAISISADGRTLFIKDAPGAWGLLGTSAIYSMPVTGEASTLLFSGSPLFGGGFISVSRDGTGLFVADLGIQGSDPPGKVIRLSLVPTANAGPDQLIECTGPSGTPIILDGSGSSDPDDDPLTYTWTWESGSAEGVNPTVVLPSGITEVTLTVSDGKATATDIVSITVQDTISPVTTATGGNGGWYNTNVISIFSAIDGCSGVKEIHYTVNGAETLTPGDSASLTLTADGIYSIAYYSIDTAGNIESPKSMTIKIDKTPPALNLKASPSTLWPPNHKMVNILIGGGATDALSDVASVVFTVKDEYGTVQPSINEFNISIPLEAWREGTDKDGRRYTITATATDAAGNKSSAITEVLVPHDQR